jgi:hypothetical protein
MSSSSYSSSSVGPFLDFLAGVTVGLVCGDLLAALALRCIWLSVYYRLYFLFNELSSSGRSASKESSSLMGSNFMASSFAAEIGYEKNADPSAP